MPWFSVRKKNKEEGNMMNWKKNVGWGEKYSEQNRVTNFEEKARPVY